MADGCFKWVRHSFILSIINEMNKKLYIKYLSSTYVENCQSLKCCPGLNCVNLIFLNIFTWNFDLNSHKQLKLKQSIKIIYIRTKNQKYQNYPESLYFIKEYAIEDESLASTYVECRCGEEFCFKCSGGNHIPVSYK